MRYAIVSDIHANLQAWEATLADIREVGVHQIICLGDVVGYGPNPQEVYESVREVADGCILGNHDAVICDRLDPVAFNPNARRIIEWTGKQLSDDAKQWFADLPMLIDATNFQCAHAEFEIPERFRYVFSAHDATPSFAASTKPLLFVGHTHRQAVFVKEGDQRPRQLPADSFDCLDDCRYLINVGSVGDPRNGEVAGSYVIVDVEDGHVEFRQVPFDVQAYRDAILKAGLSTRPMLFNFVGDDGFGKDTSPPAAPEDEFKPRDDVLATRSKASDSTKSAPATTTDSEPAGGQADVESIARGAALLLVPLVIIGFILILTRPDTPETPPADHSPTVTGVDKQPPPQLQRSTPTDLLGPATPPAQTTATNTDADIQPPPSADSATPPATTTQPIKWPPSDATFPGREFRLPQQPPANSLSAVAEAVVAGAATLVSERANAYLADRKDLADTPEYQALFDEAVAAAEWQTVLAKSYESAIGQTGAIRTWQGEKRVQIKSVAANGLQVRTVLRSGELVDQFIPFDDLPDDERRRRLSADAPRMTALMHGISSLRAGLTDQSATTFAEVGGLLASGMLELQNNNRDALHTRAAYRALTILYHMLTVDPLLPPATVAAQLPEKRFSVRDLAKIRRAVDAFRDRFGDTPTATAAAPVLDAIDQIRPQFFTPLRPNPAHAFSLAAAALATAADNPDQKVLVDQADANRVAIAASDATTANTAVGDLIELTRQDDCLQAPLDATLAGNPAMTIAFWARSPESNATRTPVSLGPTAGATDRFAVAFRKTYGVSIGDRQWDSGVPVRNGVWQYHVVTRGEGGSLTWWLFDQKVAQGRLGGDLDLSGSILIGANLGGLNGDRRIDVFRGLIKDLHVYPRILLDDEIHRLGQDARTFAVAARLDNRLAPTPADTLPAPPIAPFLPKPVDDAKFVLQKNGLTWQQRSDFAAGTIIGDGAAAAGIAPGSKIFRTVAFVPANQANLAGCVFRIRTIPGGIVAESRLVKPGGAVLFELPLATDTGRLQLETAFFGSPESQAHWLQPGFYK